ncbi:hypothetical protein E2320_013690 [Naja naja]|nr:hypothetical protein E2320_013690 [Naja naja]
METTQYGKGLWALPTGELPPAKMGAKLEPPEPCVTLGGCCCLGFHVYFFHLPFHAHPQPPPLPT